MKQSVARVAYADPQGIFHELHVKLRTEINELRSLHWSLGDGRPVRTIQRLQLDLEPLTTVQRRPHQILGVNDAPIAQILFVKAESTEVYRREVREEVAKCRKAVESSRDPTGLVVVMYAPSGVQHSKGAWTRLVTDVGISDRAVQLFLGEQDEQEQWARLASVIKTQVLAAFGERVALYEEEIRKLQSTRDVIGWNFGILFAMEDGLAWTFEKLDFLRDALEIYQQLETMAGDDVFNENSESPQAHQVRLQLLSIDRDVTTTSMLGKTATEFEFLRYIIARQVCLHILMARDERTPSMSERLLLEGLRHARTTMPRLLSLLPAQMRPLFKLQAARELEKILQSGTSLKNGADSKALASELGELILLQRDAAQELGAAHNLSVVGVMNDISIEDHQSSNAPEVEEAEPWLQSSETLTTEFIRLTTFAIELFRKARLERAVFRLVSQLAQIKFASGKPEECWKLLQEVGLGANKEVEIQSSQAALLSMAMDCARELNLDRELLSLAWSLLSLAPLGSLTPALAGTCVYHISNLGDIEQHELDLEKWFIIGVEPYIVPIDHHYGLRVSIDLKMPRLPFIKPDFVELECYVDNDLVPGSQNRKIVFRTQGPVEGRELCLITNKFVQGTLRMAQLRFVHKLQALTHNFVPQSEDDDTYIVSMQPMESCINAEIQLSRFSTITKRNLEICIVSPFVLAWARVNIQSMEMSLELLRDQLDVSKLKSFTKAKATIPALISEDQPTSQIRVVIEYPGGGRYEFTHTVDLSLQAHVRVQEYFRSNHIFSHFMVEPMLDCPVTVLRGELKGSRKFEVLAPAGLGDTSQPHIAFERSPVSYVFPLKMREGCHAIEGSRLGADANMQLDLIHRLVLWECYAIIAKEVRARLVVEELEDYMILVQRALRLLNIDAATYATQGRICVETTGVERLVAAQFRYLKPWHAERIAKALLAVIESLKERKESDFVEAEFESLNVTLSIPVPDPEAVYVHYISLELEKAEDLTVGTPVAAELSIRSVQVQKGTNDSPDLVYELDHSSDVWSYSGRTRGRYDVVTGVSEKIYLVPTRPGRTLLPRVSVMSKNGSVPSETVDAHAATKVFVMPETNTVAVAF